MKEDATVGMKQRQKASNQHHEGFHREGPKRSSDILMSVG